MNDLNCMLLMYGMMVGGVCFCVYKLYSQADKINENEVKRVFDKVDRLIEQYQQDQKPPPPVWEYGEEVTIRHKIGTKKPRIPMYIRRKK